MATSSSGTATTRSTIAARWPAISTTGSGNDSLNNSGTLTGDVALGDGNNTIDNSGTVTGNVTTGAGNDSW